MSPQLFAQAIAKFCAGIVLTAAFIFIPAGSFSYVQAWIFMGVLFVPMCVAGFVMMVRCPDLLAKRLHAHEAQSDQKTVIALSGLMFIAGFVAAGFCWRFNVAMMPFPVTIVGCVIFLLSYIGYAEVLRENAYLSRTIEIQEDQSVVDTGLYGIVRHPMYACTLSTSSRLKQSFVYEYRADSCSLVPSPDTAKKTAEAQRSFSIAITTVCKTYLKLIRRQSF